MLHCWCAESKHELMHNALFPKRLMDALSLVSVPASKIPASSSTQMNPAGRVHEFFAVFMFWLDKTIVPLLTTSSHWNALFIFTDKKKKKVRLPGHCSEWYTKWKEPITVHSLHRDIGWRAYLTCQTPVTALAMRIRRITTGSTKAVVVSSPSSNRANT